MNYTGIEGNHDAWTCPQCQGPIDIAEIRLRAGTIGDETVYSHDVHIECMTCPQILGMIINVAELNVTLREET